MARLFIFTKLFLLSSFNLSLIPISDAIKEGAPQAPPTLVFWLFIIMMLSIEVLLIASSGFRAWLKSGIENGDGVLNSKDVNGLIIYYASLWFLRLFVLNHLLNRFYGVPIPVDHQLLLFFGATGSQSIGVLRTFLIKRKSD